MPSRTPMHADGDWQAVEGVLTKQRHGVRRWIPPDSETKAQYHKNGVGSLPPQQQGN